MPEVWLLTGHKAGDNAQMRALASALDFEAREIAMRYSRIELMVTLTGRPSLAGIEAQSRRLIKPPWPALVLTAGRRNEAAARYIGKASGGGTKIVHLGRPWHHPSNFDLVLFTPQYLLEAGEGLVELELALQSPTHTQTTTSRFSHLPRPHIALLIGGNSGALTLASRHTKRLTRLTTELAESLSGSLLISTSARTPALVTAHLKNIQLPHHLWCWGQADNPYADYLASADAVIVTCDSASMLSDALASRKPVLLFDFSDADWWRHAANYRLNALAHRAAMRLAPRRIQRDIGRLQERLVESGHASWLVEGLTQLPSCTPYENTDLMRAANAVKKLLGVD